MHGKALPSQKLVSHAHHAYIGAFVKALARSGLRHLVFAPGSRSTPLLVLARRQPEIKLWSHIDERSAAFFALGLAKGTGQAVGLLCTSGSAAANFFPAVVEAYYGRVPLLLLTADRPHELRDVGAPQAMDQIHLYGRHVKWFVEMAPSRRDPRLLRYSSATAGRAVAVALQAPAGPVHVNFPLQEPLLPTAPPDEAHAPAPFTCAQGQTLLADAAIDALARRLAKVERGLLLCGPQRDPALPKAAAQLARALGWPLLADPLSQLRCGPHDRSLVLTAYDAVLKDAGFTGAYKPEAVLRLGAMPTSKAVLLYLEATSPRHHLVVDEGGWRDPTALATDFIQAEPGSFCRQLAAAFPRPVDGPYSPWTQAWLRADGKARQVINSFIGGIGGSGGGSPDDQPPAAEQNPAEPDSRQATSEIRVFAELASLLPPGAALFAGSSMPVRDLDTAWPAMAKPIHFYANRGLNGIDGVVSSALGLAAARDGSPQSRDGDGPEAGNARGDACLNPQGPVVLVIGDLSFFHDLNGLLAAKLHGLSLTVVLVNNDGGGIFSFLPQAQGVEDFEPLFATPTALNFRSAVEMFGGRFIEAPTWEAFRRGVRSGLTRGGLTVVEVKTDRQKNVEEHQALWRAVQKALPMPKEL